MISFLVGIIVLCVVVYVVKLVLDMLTLPPVVKQVAYIILGLVALFWLLDAAGLYSVGSLR